MLLEPWVYWTLLAAFMQAIRTAGQKQFTSTVTPLAATLVRYLYGLPFALLWLYYQLDTDLPDLNAVFVVSAIIAGCLQIVATLLLIRLMSMRNFAVGSSFAKSEILLTALMGFVFFAERVSPTAWLAMFCCVSGLLIVSVRGQGQSLWHKSSLYGLGAGLCFALTSLFLRQASLSLGLNDAPLSAAVTLAYMVSLQTVISLIAVRWWQPGQITQVLRYWRFSLFIGFTAVAGSVGWFTAMTLVQASYVKTLGQVEFLITLLVAIFYFKEIPTKREWIGMVLIVLGGLILI